MPTALMQLRLHTNELLHSHLTVLLPGLQDIFPLDTRPVFFLNPAPDGAFQTLKTNFSLLQDNWDLMKIQILFCIFYLTFQLLHVTDVLVLQQNELF